MGVEMGNVLVLLSGGIDSGALLKFYTDQGCRVCALHIQYGQSSAISELDSARSLAEYYGVELLTVELGFSLPMRRYEYILRNTMLVMVGASQIPLTYSRIAIGIHNGVPYYDCTPLFVEHNQHILDGYFAGSIILEAPFREMSKRQVYEYCAERGVPIAFTYSCESQNYTPCGVCPSCNDRKVFLNDANRGM